MEYQANPQKKKKKLVPIPCYVFNQTRIRYIQIQQIPYTKGKTFHQRNKSKLKKSHENTTKTSSLIAQKYHKFKLGKQVN